MSTLEILLQHKIGEDWPVVTLETRAGSFLPVRSEGALALDLQALNACADPLDYGTLLGKAVFRDEARDAFSRALSQTRAAGETQPMRVLLTVEDLGLRPLHWERLCAPFEGGWDFLALNQQTPFSLYLPALTDRRFPAIGRRDLRMLLLVASPQDLKDPFGLEQFDVAATAQAVQASLTGTWGAIPVDLLANLPGALGKPDLQTLCETLTASSYSLLHIVCHGKFDRAKGETFLYLPGDGGLPVTGSQLIERLRRLQGAHGLPHFAFLMTCESASPQAEAGFGGVAQRLVRELGFPAVLAMTEPVSIATANALAGAYYARLYAHGEPDRALSEALAGPQGRLDITVPAIFSRLGGRPLFSDTLDRPLTQAETLHGLERLQALAAERAPVLQPALAALAARLAGSTPAEGATAQARQERAGTLAEANHYAEEIVELSFPALALDQPTPAYDGRCPFIGLAAFRPQDRAFFFGREALVETLAKRLAEHPFLAVLGASGSGKSSLVMAGLLPRLGQPDAAVFTPGAEPLARLEAALAAAKRTPTAPAEVLVVDQFEELFTLCKAQADRQAFLTRLLGLAGPRQVVLTMRADFLGECAPYPELKQAIQQHTELVAPMDGAELRRAIEQQAGAVGLRFEADLADDILEDVQGEPGAMPLLQHALLLLWQRRRGRWLRSAEYRAIGGVSKAISNTADEIYAQLSEPERERMRAVFLRLTRLEEDPTPGVERRDTRRRALLNELIPAGSQREATVALVSRLADARLVATSSNPLTGQEEVEVAHEALIRHWPRLRGWLDEDRAGLRLSEGVSEAAQEWAAAQRDESLLVHRGGRLEDAWALAQSGRYSFNQAEIDYLAACRALRERERQAADRRRKIAIGAAIGVALVMSVLGLWGLGRAREAGSQAATATSALGLSNQRGTDVSDALGLSNRRGTEVAQQATSVASALDLSNQRGTEAARQEQAANLARVQAQEQAQISLARQLAVQANDPGVDERAALLLALESLKNHPESLANQVVSARLKLLPVTYGYFPLKMNILDGSAAINPDGTQVAVSTSDSGKEVLLWDVTSRKVIAQWKLTRANYAPPLIFSPDGKRLAVEDGNDSLIWEVASGKETRISHSDTVTAQAFSPDGARLLVVVANQQVAVFDAATGQVLRSFPMPVKEDEMWAEAAFSADRKRLITNTTNQDTRKGTVQVWDVESGERIGQRAMQAQVRFAGLDATGQVAVMVDEDGHAAVWKPGGDPAALEFDARGGAGARINRIDYSPEGARLAVALNTGSIFLWDTATGKLMSTVEHGTEAWDITFEPGGQRLLTAGLDPFAHVWDVETGRELARAFHPGRTYQAGFSQDGKRIFSVSEDGPPVGEDSFVQVWGLADPIPYEYNSNTISAVAGIFSPDGKSVFLTGNGDTIWKLDSATHAVTEIETGLLNDNADLAQFSPDGSRVLAYNNHSLRAGVVRLDGGETVTVGGVSSYNQWSRDGRRVLSVRQNGALQVWDPDTGQPVSDRLQVEMNRDDPGNFQHLDLNPDGSRVALSGPGGKITIWDVLTGKKIHELDGGGAIMDVAFDAAGKRIAAGGTARTITVWDAQTGQKLGAFPFEALKNGYEMQILFSLDGKQVITIFKNGGIVRVWDIDSGQETAHMQHSAEVRSAALSADGRWLVTVSDDQTARVWELASGQEMARTVHKGLVGFASFSPDGKWVVSTSSGKALIWPWQPQDLIDLACARGLRDLTAEEWQQYLGSRPSEPTCPNMP